MSIDKNKKYKIGSKVFGWADGAWTSPPSTAWYHDFQMELLFDEGLATEVEEPMVRTSVIEFDSGSCCVTHCPSIHAILGSNEEEAKNSTWDIVATRRPK